MKRNEYTTDGLDLELLFLSGNYEDYPLRLEMRWLLHYFKTPVQYTWLKYYTTFGSLYKFQDRTGLVITTRYGEFLSCKMRRLQKLLEQAKANYDLPLIQAICSGQYQYRRKGNVGNR